MLTQKILLGIRLGHRKPKPDAEPDFLRRSVGDSPRENYHMHRDTSKGKVLTKRFEWFRTVLSSFVQETCNMVKTACHRCRFRIESNDYAQKPLFFRIFVKQNNGFEFSKGRHTILYWQGGWWIAWLNRKICSRCKSQIGGMMRSGRPL